MSKIEKSWWQWDNQHDRKDFYLGAKIDDLLQEGLVMNDPDETDKYLGISPNSPWTLMVKNGLVQSIAYRRDYFGVLEEDIWTLHKPKLDNVLGRILNPGNPDKAGDFLYTVFRDGYITLVMLVRKGK